MRNKMKSKLINRCLWDIPAVIGTVCFVFLLQIAPNFLDRVWLC